MGKGRRELPDLFDRVEETLPFALPLHLKAFVLLLQGLIVGGEFLRVLPELRGAEIQHDEKVGQLHKEMGGSGGEEREGWEYHEFRGRVLGCPSSWIGALVGAVHFEVHGWVLVSAVILIHNPRWVGGCPMWPLRSRQMHTGELLPPEGLSIVTLKCTFSLSRQQ